MNANWMSDARKIPDDVMDYLRRIAVRAIIDGKNSPELIAEIFHVSRSCIYRWLSWFNDGGYDALDTHKAPGKKPLITAEIDIWLKNTILHSTPADYGYDTELWTLKILAALLERHFGIKVYESTVFNHLHRIEVSCEIRTSYGHPQKPPILSAWHGRMNSPLHQNLPHVFYRGFRG